MKERLFVCVFFVICFIPMLVMFLPLSFEDNHENESASQLPLLRDGSGGINVNYLGEVSEYYDDGYGLREQMITAQHMLTAAVFNESEEDKVILGRDGWLFYKETLDDYEGINIMSDDECKAAVRTLYLIDEYCRMNGMRFLFTVAPNKNSLYGQMMPQYYPASHQKSNAERIGDYLEDSRVMYVDLFDAFGKEDKILYRKSDSHWNNEGAAFASDCIAKELGLETAPFYGGKSKITKAERGDLHDMLYPSAEDKDTDVLFEREFTYEYASPMRSVEDNFIRTVNKNRTGTLFMFRDSFGNTQHRYMAEYFGKGVFCRLNPYNLTLAVKEKADVVAVELVERNLDWILTKPPVFPAPVRKTDVSECEMLTDVEISCPEDDELDGYRRLEGKIFGSDINEYDEIYIAASGILYEATPHGNGEFVLYLPDDAVSGSVAVLGKITKGEK